jgi:hypothetical protein
MYTPPCAAHSCAAVWGLGAGLHVPFAYVPPVALQIELMLIRLVPVLEQAAETRPSSATREIPRNFDR